MTYLSKTVFKIISALIVFFMLSVITAEKPIATLRGAELNTQTQPPRVMQEDNTDQKKQRNYTSQPPVIPHSIESYRIDLNSNKCLTCHARSRTGDSGAPMVSVTHFMDRDGQFRATVSSRRYFCTQCHVAQLNVKPLVDNVFVDVDELLDATKNATKKN